MADAGHLHLHSVPELYLEVSTCAPAYHLQHAATENEVSMFR